MAPINLELLQAGDDAEWRRAWDEWGLWHLARAIVACYLQYHPQHVDDVASIALTELVDAVKQIQNEPGIETRLQGVVAHFLRNLARWRALGFLERLWTQREQPLPDERQEQEHQGERGMAVFLEEALRFDICYEAVIDELAEAAELDVLEKALLREHVVEGLTQQEFADKYGLPLGTVGNLKREVLDRIMELLEQEQRNQRTDRAVPRRRKRAEPARNNLARDRSTRHGRPKSKGKSRGKKREKISRRKKSSRTD